MCLPVNSSLGFKVLQKILNLDDGGFGCDGAKVVVEDAQPNDVQSEVEKLLLHVHNRLLRLGFSSSTFRVWIEDELAQMIHPTERKGGESQPDTATGLKKTNHPPNLMYIGMSPAKP